MRIRPARTLAGEVRLPGDKSLSHRHILRSALLKGSCRLKHLNTGDDVRRSLEAVRALGVKVNQESATCWHLESPGFENWNKPAADIDCGNSGTTARLLMGLLAACPFDSRLIGDASLSRRPMERVALALRQMGAEIHTREGGLPVEILGRPLSGMEWKLPIASAQLKSAVMLAALFAEGDTKIVESLPSRDHTERMLGLNPEILTFDNGGEPGITRSWTLSSRDRPTQIWNDAEMPGDPSSAAFLVGAALALPESDLRIRDLLVNPYRRAYLDLLIEWGAMIEIEEQPGEGFCGPIFCGSDCSPGEQCPISEPVADLRVRSGLDFESSVISGRMVPRLIDEIPLLAAVALARNAGLEVRDASELRYKESDRIAGICRMARAFGAKAEELEDGFKLSPAPSLHAAHFDAQGDHRLAMAAAVLALRAEDESRIDGDEAVDISFPNFLEELNRLLID